MISHGNDDLSLGYYELSHAGHVLFYTDYVLPHADEALSTNNLVLTTSLCLSFSDHLQAQKIKNKKRVYSP